VDGDDRPDPLLLCLRQLRGGRTEPGLHQLCTPDTLLYGLTGFHTLEKTRGALMLSSKLDSIADFFAPLRRESLLVM
jgi:hypothetical protein